MMCHLQWKFGLVIKKMHAAEHNFAKKKNAGLIYKPQEQ